MLEFHLDLNNQQLRYDSEVRPFTDQDVATLAKFSSFPQDAKRLAQKIYAWLDGSENWLSDFVSGEDPPYLVVLNVEPFADASQRSAAQTFLDVPWELMRSANQADGTWVIMRRLPADAQGLQIGESDVFERLTGGHDDLKAYLYDLALESVMLTHEVVKAIQDYVDEGHDIQDVKTRNWAKSHCLAAEASLSEVWDLHQEALKTNLKRLPLVETIDDPRVKAKCLMDVSKNYMSMEKLSKAIKYCYQAQAALKNTPYKFERAIVLENIALLHLQEEKIKKSIKQLEEAAEIFREIDHQEDYAFCLTKLSGNYLETEQFDKASAVQQEAIAILEKLEDDPQAEQSLVMCRLGTGQVHMHCGDYDQALAVFEQAKTDSEAWEFDDGIILSLMNLIEVYGLKEDWKKVEALTEELEQAQALAESYDDDEDWDIPEGTWDEGDYEDEEEDEEEDEDEV